MSQLFAGKKIVVPFDFSADSEAVVRQVLEWSDKSTEIFVVTVLAPIDSVPVAAGTMMEVVDDAERIQSTIDDIRSRFKDPRLGVEVCAGDPTTEIVEYIDRVSADMAVMPTHGRSGIRRLAMGSVAEKVVRLASCTVLVVRGTDLTKAS